MKDIVKIFDKYNLTYWLDGGTLLGAKKHNGFIPWDDDIDICMPSEDYVKALDLLKKHFLDNFIFWVSEKAITLNYFQIRISKMGLNIFPVDEYYNDGLNEEEKQKVSEKIVYAKESLDKKYNQKRFSECQLKDAKEDILLYTKKYILEGKEPVENLALFICIDFLYHPQSSLVMNNHVLYPLQIINFFVEILNVLTM